MKGRGPRNVDMSGEALPLWQQRDPPWVHVFLGLALVLLLSWADWAVGPRVSLDYFYILPVILAAWRGNRDVSLFLVFACGIGWFVCEWPFGGQPKVNLPPELAHSALAAELRPDPLFRIWEATMLTGFLAVVCLLTCRLRETFERERSHARTDALTGLANRRTFCERLEHEIERMRRTERPFTLAVIDLDNFKYVNDHFGHLAGDDVLRLVAAHMLSHLRTTDLPGRIGGDEFALLLTETDATGARTCLMDLLSELTTSMGERGWPVGCSIGAVTFRVTVDSVNEALHLADEQMYAAKRAGKGRLEQEVYFGPGAQPASASAEPEPGRAAPPPNPAGPACPTGDSPSGTPAETPAPRPKPVGTPPARRSETSPAKTKSNASVVPAKATVGPPARARKDRPPA